MSVQALKAVGKIIEYGKSLPMFSDAISAIVSKPEEVMLNEDAQRSIKQSFESIEELLKASRYHLDCLTQEALNYAVMDANVQDATEKEKKGK